MTAHAPVVTTKSTALTCPTCRRPWPCAGWRSERERPHAPSVVPELVGRAPHYGMFCLACSQPWPCPEAPEST